MKELISGKLISYQVPSLQLTKRRKHTSCHTLPLSEAPRGSWGTSASILIAYGAMEEPWEHSHSLWGQGGALEALTQPGGPRRSPESTHTACGANDDPCEHSHSLWCQGGALGALTQPVEPRRSSVSTYTACGAKEEPYEHSHSLQVHGGALGALTQPVGPWRGSVSSIHRARDSQNPQVAEPMAMMAR